MNLTLAIPAHNDLNDLCRLLAHAQELDIMSRVVVVDDGSDIPITIDALLGTSGLSANRLTLLRHDTALGPGVARNHALEQVQTEHMLFMDADDLPTRELAHLLHDLNGKTFDFCIFQHHDTRMEREHSWGQTQHDRVLWQKAGVDVGSLCPVPPDAAALLSRTANYPWNKIYRTKFLRDNDISCSNITVHEDIELHWRSFLNATRILASDRVGVVHTFHEQGARLTNRTGPERLAVFAPLGRIADEINTSMEKNSHLALPFFRFSLGLFDWISANLQHRLQPQFTTLVQYFLRDHTPPALLDEITETDPALVARVQGPPPTIPPAQTGG